VNVSDAVATAQQFAADLPRTLREENIVRRTRSSYGSKWCDAFSIKSVTDGAA